MREWYSLCCYFLPAAIEIVGQRVGQEVANWPRLIDAYVCLVVAIRLVAGFRPASALDQVSKKQKKKKKTPVSVFILV